jgi:hypothetical protein
MITTFGLSPGLSGRGLFPGAEAANMGANLEIRHPAAPAHIICKKDLRFITLTPTSLTAKDYSFAPSSFTISRPATPS